MDWVNFLEDNSVHFINRGPNTKRGEISVQCPYCGDDDPSQHLGISLTTENWGCHRSPLHRGHKASSLIAALLGVSFQQAKLIEQQYSQPDPSNLDQALATLVGLTSHAAPPPAYPAQAPPTPRNPTHSTPLSLPDDFRAVRQQGVTSRFWRYLLNRGFDDPDALCRDYGLKCAVTGRWKERIVIPFYQGGNLLAWTGRAIQKPISAPRYLSSSDAVKQTIFNEDVLADGGKLLFVVEGPFDALKLDYHAEPLGARATCVFGTSISMDQISILIDIRKRFDKVVILFDHDAVEPAFYASDWLQAPNVSIGRLPEGVKDPGEMTEKQIVKLVKSYK